MPREAEKDRNTSPHTKRRKISVACEPCRARKARCNGAKPECGNCVQRLERCVYRLSNVQLAEANDYIDSLVNKVSELENKIEHVRDTPSYTANTVEIRDRVGSQASNDGQVLKPESYRSLPEQAPVLFPTPADALHQSPQGAASHIVMDESSPMDAMGGNADFDRASAPSEKFYGSSSSASFMKQFYHMISRHDGNARGRHHRVHLRYTGLENYSLMPRAMSDYFLDLYWRKVYHLYPIIFKPVFLKAYEQLWSPASGHETIYRPELGLGGYEHAGPTSPVFHCALNSMMVLGLQFSDLPLSEKQDLTQTLILRAKSQFHLDMLDDGNIEVIQAMLLLVQIFQFSTFPSRCWNILGGACRLALGLGLQLSDSRLEGHLKTSEIEMRRRIWHCCHMLDMVVSMTLGRPTMLRDGTDVPLPQAIDDEYLDRNEPQPHEKISSMSFFVEAIKTYRVLNDIVSQLYGDNARNRPDSSGGHGSFDRLVDFDKKLCELENQLPNHLDPKNEPNWSDDVNGMFAQQRHVLRSRTLHMRVLLYRAAFSDFCRNSSTLQQPYQSEAVQTSVLLSMSPAISFGFYCSLKCVQNAIDLIDMTHQYASSDTTGAWWYNMFYTRAAAMVVLLAMVCPLVRDSIGMLALQKAWKNCQSILLHELPQEIIVKSCLKTLQKMHDHISSDKAEAGSEQFRANEVRGLTGDKSSNLKQYDSYCTLPITSGPATETAAMMPDGYDPGLDFPRFDDYLGGVFNDPVFNFAIDDYGTTLL